MTLTPTYGLGTSGRTGVSINISGPRTRIGSQGRIYAYYKNRGEGEAYKQHLIDALGLQFMPKVNPQSYI